jgi:hypothetical protein
MFYQFVATPPGPSLFIIPLYCFPLPCVNGYRYWILVRVGSYVIFRRHLLARTSGSSASKCGNLRAYILSFQNLLDIFFRKYSLCDTNIYPRTPYAMCHLNAINNSYSRLDLNAAFHVNPDPDLGFWGPKMEQKIQFKKKFCLFSIKNCNLPCLSLGLYRERPSYRRSRQP